jgi:hypothetical protein
MLHNLLAEKEGRIWFNTTSLKLYQCRRITWWCLFILKFVLQFAMQSVLKFVLLEKLIKKVMVSRNLCQTHLQEAGLTQIPEDLKPYP